MTRKPVRHRDSIVIEQDWTGQWIAVLGSYDGPESPIGTGKDPVQACEELMEAIGWQVPQ